ncbi:hypothetical protein PG999_013979 [Apiospora kogelbergensis]|uniref:Zn(2)-C6 fungal-type domain-containing protein n=1 Tax=Apiospora kogelbergensis TaxID=1337665 RepID=A0AAW0Q9Q6_9PEZI
MRYSVTRQKACYQCSSAKAKCDNNAAGCSRCTLRGLTCTYPVDAPTPASRSSQRRARRTIDDDQIAPAALPLDAAATPAVGGNEGDREEARDQLDFSCLDLVCPINADDITTRWLHPYVPVPGQVTKDYHPRISDLIYRVLKSYANGVISGTKPPPFVHASQLQVPVPSPALVNCLRIARMCDKSHPSSDNSLAAEILQKEMAKIGEQATLPAVADIDLLATFQAHIIYTMILFFHLYQSDGEGEKLSLSVLRQAMMSLQDLAGTASRQGLVGRAAADRPRWEAWLVAEAKRRTLYVLYLFDNVLSRHEGLPTFLGTELRGLPAPAGGALWTASTRREWEARYDADLAQWSEDGGLRIDELWAVPPGLDEVGVARRRDRVDRWLVDVDAFGMMIYTVTSCTHGG